MTPFDETLPVSDPLELAHRQLKDATERENRLNAEIDRLTKANLEQADALFRSGQLWSEQHSRANVAEERLGRVLADLGAHRERERMMLDLINQYREQNLGGPVVGRETGPQIPGQGIIQGAPTDPGNYHEGLGGMGTINRCDCTMGRGDLLFRVERAIRTLRPKLGE